MTRHLNISPFSQPDHAPATTPQGTCTSDWGAGCRNFSRLPARGEAFSLDILFYRTKRASLPGESEKAGPSGRHRDVPGEPAQPVAPLERGVFRKYWPI